MGPCSQPHFVASNADLFTDFPDPVSVTCNKQPWNAFWGQRYAQVADPDGNLVDLFAAL